MNTSIVDEHIVKFPIDYRDAPIFVDHVYAAIVCARYGEGYSLITGWRQAGLPRCRKDVKGSIYILSHVANIGV
jgi:hypothetical protein